MFIPYVIPLCILRCYGDRVHRPVPAVGDAVCPCIGSANAACTAFACHVHLRRRHVALPAHMGSNHVRWVTYLACLALKPGRLETFSCAHRTYSVSWIRYGSGEGPAVADLPARLHCTVMRAYALAEAASCQGTRRGEAMHVNSMQASEYRCPCMNRTCTRRSPTLPTSQLDNGHGNKLQLFSSSARDKESLPDRCPGVISY